MAIEEAVVGGFGGSGSGAVLRQVWYEPAYSITRRNAFGHCMRFPQYRYREEGIRLVHQLGFQKAIDKYLEEPGWFWDQLFQTAAA